MEKNKVTISAEVLLNVKNMMKKADDKHLVKSHVEAFEKTPVKFETHKGKTSYFEARGNF